MMPPLFFVALPLWFEIVGRSKIRLYMIVGGHELGQSTAGFDGAGRDYLDKEEESLQY